MYYTCIHKCDMNPLNQPMRHLNNAPFETTIKQTPQTTQPNHLLRTPKEPLKKHTVVSNCSPLNKSQPTNTTPAPVNQHNPVKTLSGEAAGEPVLQLLRNFGRSPDQATKALPAMRQAIKASIAFQIPYTTSFLGTYGHLDVFFFFLQIVFFCF